MSEVKSIHPVKLVILVSFFGVMGLVGMAGFLYVGWKLVDSSSPNDLETETEERSMEVVGGREIDVGQAPHEKKPRGVAGWLGSAKMRLAVIEAERDAQRTMGVENMQGPKGPMIASRPIATDEGVYLQYINRKDVLVMVEYYADW